MRDQLHAPQFGYPYKSWRRAVELEADLNPAWAFDCDDCGYHQQGHGPVPTWCAVCQNEDIELVRRGR